LCRAGGTHSNINKPSKEKHTNTLFHLDFVEIISLPDKGVFLAKVLITNN